MPKWWDNTRSARRYATRVLTAVFRDFWSFVQGQIIVGLILGTTILLLQIKSGIISKSMAIPNVQAFILPYLGLLVALIIWLALRALYLVNKEDQARIERLSSELELTKLLEASVLTPLQMDVLSLSRDLREFLRELGPAPQLPVGASTLGLDQIGDWTGEYAEWARRMIYRYRSDFAPRVRDIANTIGANTGMVVVSLEPYCSDVRPGHDFDVLLDTLLGFVAKLEDPSAKRNMLPSPSEPSQPPQSTLQFWSVQVSAFELAKDLIAFTRELGEIPDVSSKDFPDTALGQYDFLVRRNALQEPWLLKFRSGYRARFAERLKMVVDLFGTHGIQRPFLDECVNGEIRDADDARRVSELLVSAAFEMDGIRVFPPRSYTEQQLEMMSGSERDLRIKEEPGFLEAWKRYQLAKALSNKLTTSG